MLPNLIQRIPFSSMQSLCPSILLFLAAAFFPIGTSRAEMRIRPPGQGANHSVYVLATGSRLELECELERGDYSGPEDVDSLDWMRGRLRIAHNWLSMYTQPKVDEQGRWIRQTLVIPKMEQQTAGDYSCLFYDDKKRTVHLHVLERLNWRTPTEKPGGPLGQPLTIDCGAEGVPDEAVKILDHKGRAIEESTQGEVLVAGADATIQRLGREHQGMKIRCVAVRRIILDSPNSSAAPYDSLHTDERELTVDVWLPPKFDDREPGPRYAVPGSRQVLTWTVLESNPPVSAWNLRKDGRAIRIAPSEREAKPGVKKPRMEFVQNMDAAQPLFAVVFNDVQSEDFGRYTLVVHNGKLESEKTLTMVLIEPPSQPRVSVEWVSSNGSVNWRVEEQRGKGQLPTTYYLITYKPLKRVPLPQQNVSTTNGMQGRPSEPQLLPLPPIDPNVSNSAPYYVRRRKNPRNLYEMAGLDPYTEYEFTFTAGNFEAGEGDPIQVKLITVDWQRPDGPGVDQTSSAASRIEAGFPFGSRMLAMFAAMLLPTARQLFGAALPQQQFTL